MADFQAGIRIDLEQIEKALGKLPSGLPRAVLAGMKASAMVILRRVVMERMSDPSPGRFPNLGVVTGTGRRSMVARAMKLAHDRISLEVGSPLKYIRAHELGFEGDVNVTGHTRHLVAPPDIRKGKITKTSARRLKAALRAGRATTAFVKPHKRFVHIRARGFIRRSINTELEPTRQRVLRAIEHLARTGKAPGVGDIFGADLGGRA
jgi:hypothetical protein